MGTVLSALVRDFFDDVQQTPNFGSGMSAERRMECRNLDHPGSIRRDEICSGELVVQTVRKDLLGRMGEPEKRYLTTISGRSAMAVPRIPADWAMRCLVQEKKQRSYEVFHTHESLTIGDALLFHDYAIVFMRELYRQIPPKGGSLFDDALLAADTGSWH